MFMKHHVFVFQLYKYGHTVSFVFWTDTCKPESYFDRILENKKRGLHTLCLLGKTFINNNEY